MEHSLIPLLHSLHDQHASVRGQLVTWGSRRGHLCPIPEPGEGWNWVTRGCAGEDNYTASCGIHDSSSSHHSRRDCVCGGGGRRGKSKYITFDTSKFCSLQSYIPASYPGSSPAEKWAYEASYTVGIPLIISRDYIQSHTI